MYKVSKPLHKRITKTNINHCRPKTSYYTMYVPYTDNKNVSLSVRICKKAMYILRWRYAFSYHFVVGIFLTYLAVVLLTG